MRINKERVVQQLKEYARGLGGGLIFGLPILFTQEVWHQGFIISPYRLGIFLLFQYVLILGILYYAGFREEHTFKGLAFEAVETLGLAFILSAIVLSSLGLLTANMSAEEIVGKILLETIPVTIGVAVSTQLLGEETKEVRERKEKAAPGTVGQYVIALGGAVFFAYTFASTEEITILGTGAEWWNAIIIIALSLVVTYALVFYADFGGVGKRLGQERILETPFGETIAAYALSLVVATLILFLVGRVSFNDSLTTIIYQTVVLGLPASIGAAAGRLLI